MPATGGGTMKIAIAGIVHETNTYCRHLTRANDFYVARGERLLREQDADTSLGGALRACAELGVEVVPIMGCTAQPSGTIARGAYDELKAEILQGLKTALP